MKLTVLGGASAGPNIRQGCSGFLVESGDTRIVLDLGPGTLPELMAHADFRALDAVIISHLHIDHCLDLFALYWALSHNPVRPPGPLPLWLPPGGIAFVHDAIKALSVDKLSDSPVERAFTLAEYDSDAPLQIGCRGQHPQAGTRPIALTVRFQPTSHYIPCWAIRVEDPAGRVLAYTADTGPAADLSPLLAGVQVLVAEAMLLNETAARIDGFRGGSTPAEAAGRALQAGAETLILTHIWEERGREPALRQAARTFTGRLEIALPGLQIEW
jgi:ribonuclease BN (tRNA processing enzyme)